ncbi:hypothetical protein RJ639_032604 [Escallonia herrerae]|uniref:UBN2 domain-containing protein n=1 Tax=Escallonia herrerae TaxID=1293975 RepID=A0AA89BFY6_9ASTE|nr:hypothetical protein RJ639_032604 [Escallonia herrerae]
MEQLILDEMVMDVPNACATNLRVVKLDEKQMLKFQQLNIVPWMAHTYSQFVANVHGQLLHSLGVPHNGFSAICSPIKNGLQPKVQPFNGCLENGLRGAEAVVVVRLLTGVVAGGADGWLLLRRRGGEVGEPVGATKLNGRVVINHGGFLRRVVGAQPQPHVSHWISDLRSPFPPWPLTALFATLTPSGDPCQLRDLRQVPDGGVYGAALWKDFDILLMKEGESVQAFFFSSASNMINQIRSYEDTIEDKKIIQKILRILSMKFDHVVAAVEEFKNLNELTLVDLMGSLQAHEERMHRFEQPIEQTFQSKLNIPKMDGEKRRNESNGQKFQRKKGAVNNHG